MEEDFSSSTVKTLKEWLRSIDLPVSGNKSILIERIKHFISSKESLIDIFKEGKVLTGVKDVDILILQLLDDVRLNAVRRSNKYAAKTCNKVFWRQKVIKKYGEALR